MKKLLLSIIVLSLLNIANSAKAQVCVPDTAIHSTGIRPDKLDTATIGVAYHQIIQYFVAKDTSVVYSGNTINATIDSVKVTGVKGLPAGFTYLCNNASCTVAGGKTGCVTLSGTATAGMGGKYPLTVYLTIWAKAFLGPIPIGQTANDSNSKYFMVIKTPASVSEQDIINAKVVVYPNPAHNTLQVYIPNTANNYGYQVYSLTGQLVQKGETTGFEPIKEIVVSQLSNGIYMLHITDGDAQYLKRFVIEN